MDFFAIDVMWHTEQRRFPEKITFSDQKGLLTEDVISAVPMDYMMDTASAKNAMKHE